jgi:head-tail adaptor
MAIPTLNRPMVLEAAQRVPDGAGGFTVTWQPLGTLWAHVSLRSGRESGQMGTAASVTNYRITVRGAPLSSDERPRPDQRLRDGERMFLINAVAEADARGHYLVCFATEESVV